jgi:hypothetical protein
MFIVHKYVFLLLLTSPPALEAFYEDIAVCCKTEGKCKMLHFIQGIKVLLPIFKGILVHL